MFHPLKPLCAATLLLICAAQAHAVGRLADLTVVDRSNEVTLPVYSHAGQYWVAGKPGAKYAISLCSKVGDRLLAVISVDGLNVLSGASAGWNQTGYVFAGRTCYQITGWRKSDSEVAAFEFSASGDSYAALTGRPKELGVIGVALFRERRPEPVLAPPVSPYRRDAESFKDSAANSPAPAPAAAAESSQNNDGSASKRAAGRSPATDGSLSPSAIAPAPVQKLGTAHGPREESLVSHTEFERAQSRPGEVIVIRYESHEALVALGVIPRTVSRRVPNAFPRSGRDAYVPDPPARPD